MLLLQPQFLSDMQSPNYMFGGYIDVNHVANKVNYIVLLYGVDDRVMMDYNPSRSA